MKMPFDPFKRRPVNARCHVVAPNSSGDRAHCINCGASGWEIMMNSAGCDPDSDAAKAFRREKRDGMVGRITGNSAE
jgi:hypothetical protein